MSTIMPLNVPELNNTVIPEAEMVIAEPQGPVRVVLEVTGVVHVAEEAAYVTRSKHTTRMAALLFPTTDHTQSLPVMKQKEGSC